MRPHRLALVAVAACALTAGPLPVAAVAAAADRPVDVRRLDAFLQDQLDRNGLPGLAVGVVDGDRPVHARGFGTAREDGTPVTADTPFVLASVSKPLTATAVMQLVDSTRVALDAPVQRYLPDLRLADPEDAARITVRQLLDHTSGLPASACERDAGDLDGFLRALRNVRLAAPPGSRHLYCSGNYNLLGLVVQRVSRQSYAQYMQEHVFAPLGMAHSAADHATAARLGVADGHQWLFGLRRSLRHDNPAGVPSGYLVSSARDMTRFLQAQLHEGHYGTTQLLSPAATALMQRAAVDAGDGTSYGLGWQQGPVGGVPSVHHYGANYDAETLLLLEPQNGRAAVLLVNAQNVIATGAFRSIEAGVARMLDGQEPGAPGLPLPTSYALLDAVLVALSTALLAPALRLPAWLRTQRERAAHGRLRRRTVLRVTAELALPVVALGTATVLVTRPLGATWRQLLLLVPDLTAWLWAACAMVLGIGLAHGVALVLVARRATSTAGRPRPSRSGSRRTLAARSSA